MLVNSSVDNSIDFDHDQSERLSEVGSDVDDAAENEDANSTQRSSSSSASNHSGKRRRSGKPNAKWTDVARTTYLMDLIMEMKKRGAAYLVEKHLTERGRQCCVDNFNEKFGLDYEASQLEQRLRDLRADMQLYNEVSQQRSGWGRSDNQNPFADPPVWEAFLKSNKNRSAKKYCVSGEFVKPLEYDRLNKVWGKHDGLWSYAQAPTNYIAIIVGLDS